MTFKTLEPDEVIEVGHLVLSNVAFAPDLWQRVEPKYCFLGKKQSEVNIQHHAIIDEVGATV